MIRPATTEDAAAIARIYNHYVLHTAITFEEEAVNVAEMEFRIRDITVKYPWLVCEEGGEVVAYAYAGPWKSRSAYRYSCELAVYVEDGLGGRGYGRKVYETLLEELRDREVRVVIGGILVPNSASVALHEKLGFKKVAHFEKVGFKFGQWQDVGYWELILNDGVFAT